MNLDQIDLHGKSLKEAFDTMEKCLRWIIDRDEIGAVFIHGKGNHSNRIAVLKQEVRRFLFENEELIENDYLVIKGEDEYRITETFNEGVVVVIKRGYENEPIGGGKKQEEKRQIVFSEEGRELRKQGKKNRSLRKKKQSKNRVQNESFFDSNYNGGLISTKDPALEQFIHHVQKEVAKDEERMKKNSTEKNEFLERELDVQNEGMSEAVNETSSSVSNNTPNEGPKKIIHELRFEVKLGRAKYYFSLIQGNSVEYSLNKDGSANISQIPCLQSIGGGIIVNIVEINNKGFIAEPIAPSLVQKYAGNNIEKMQCREQLQLLIVNMPDKIFVPRDSFSPYSLGNLRTDMIVAIFRRYTYKLNIEIME